ncbi:MAG: Coenzyme F420 hydrogenase/dehydrogenase, beta subunit C-terminal domain [Bacteroidales bacterium]|nr:Coenzyme F420 hydrogenase/dehydrogenase, beta subunit C-terminal domain [Bacteroidales bacterium]
MKERIQLPTIEHCTGCQACRVACPKNAITMQENEKGNIYPVVNEQQCINCNKCANVCPELSPLTFNAKQEKVYAMWVNNTKNRKCSTSGGASYIMAKTIIERGGYLCGAIYNDGGAEHRICNNIDELYRFQGSKYVHSNVKDVYKEVEMLLKNGKEVLFTGTPCQVAALRSYLIKEYDTLYCIDIVCHGVPNKKVLGNRIKAIEKVYGKKVIDIRFRDKQPDQHNTFMKYTFEDASSLSNSYSSDPYSRSFVLNYTLRDNCFNCKYSKAERCSDITIADFWGYAPQKLKFHSYRKGTSLMIVNSEKGSRLLNEIKRFCTYDDSRDFDYAVKGNHNLKAPQIRPDDYNLFWERYLNGETLEELQKDFYPPLKKKKRSQIARIKQFIALLLPDFIVKRLIKK